MAARRARLIATRAESGALAANADPAQAVYLVPAFVGLGAPYWDAEARGALFGLTPQIRPARSSPARRSKRSATRPATCSRPCARDWPARRRRARCCASTAAWSASDWTMQFLADILDAPGRPADVLETTALGAAYLAGLASRRVSRLEGFAKTWKLDRRFSPQIDPQTRDRKWRGWQDAVRRTLSTVEAKV